MTGAPREHAFSVAVRRSFTARHYLTVPNPGPEGTPHAHSYVVELGFSGPDLDRFGYLIDIDTVDTLLDNIEDRYGGVLLNELPEFEDRNPSVERFAESISRAIASDLDETTPATVTVQVWEGETAWARHRRRLDGHGD